METPFTEIVIKEAKDDEPALLVTTPKFAQITIIHDEFGDVYAIRVPGKVITERYFGEPSDAKSKINTR
jgi:hypothetical protein